MVVTIMPSTIHGTLPAPASKSCMQRACAAALLRHGTSTLYNAGNCNDDKAALEVIQKLGAAIVNNANGSITITGRGVHPDTTEINCGESGLGIRMFAPIAALSNQPLVLTGKGSLLTRPMNFFDEIFPALDIQIRSNNGRLPLQLQGPLKPADINVDGSLSSQFITGLLIAFSAANAQAAIMVSNLTSKPYIDLTLSIMKAFELNVPVNDNYRTFTFHPIQDTKRDSHIHYTIEGDWSGASFLLVAAAIAGTITVTGLDISSAQADKAILQALELAGCKPVPGDNETTLTAASLQAFEFDAANCPDLFPPLVALASYCNGTTILHGANRLKHKESNRGQTLQEEFGKMGINIQLENDLMYITGGTVHGAIIDPHNDHRIAMACAIAGLQATGGVTINHAEVINKSYPGFYRDLQAIQHF